MGSFSYTGINFKNYSPLKIGRFCSIGDDVKVGLNAHPVDRMSTSPYFYANNWYGNWNRDVETEPFNAALPVEIGDDVWIGANVSIKGVVKIGDGAIIACGAVVTKDVPEFAIVGGVPATIINFREKKIKFAKSGDYKNWGYLTVKDFYKPWDKFCFQIKKVRKKSKINSFHDRA